MEKKVKKEFIELAKKVVVFQTKFMDEIDKLLPLEIEKIKKVNELVAELDKSIRLFDRMEENINRGLFLINKFSMDKSLIVAMNEIVPKLREIIASLRDKEFKEDFLE